MKRLLTLLVVVLVAGALTGTLSRAWRPAGPAPAPAVTQQVCDLALTVTAKRVIPDAVAIPKHRLVRLSVTNHDTRPVTLSLAGYEDRLHTPPIPPNSTWHGTFLADRPGEGFAWQINGTAVGRLDITGSHLEEGHQ